MKTLPGYAFFAVLLSCATAGLASDRAPVLSRSLAVTLADSPDRALRGVVKLRGDRRTVAHGQDVALAEASAIARQHGVHLSPLFTDTTLIDRLEQRIADRQSIADLRSYWTFPTGDAPSRQWQPLIEALNASARVDIAYLESEDAPGALPAAVTLSKPWEAWTPSFTHLQGYLDRAPTGIDAYSAWSRPGGIGQSITVMIYDNSVRSSHEDVPQLVHNHGGNAVGSEHGTAVLGIVGARDNGYGILGIAHKANFAFQGAAGALGSHAERLIAAGMKLGKGDVLLTEIGKKIGALGFECACNPTQANSVPIEFYPAEFDAITRMAARHDSLDEVTEHRLADHVRPLV